MSHELSENARGEIEMFSGSGEIPWHKLGTVVQGLVKASEAIKLAKLDWEVVKEPIKRKGKEVPGQFFVVRNDETDRILGTVKGRYTVIQNTESFDFFDEIVGSGQAVYDTAGALFGGKRIWIMAKLKAQLFIDSRPEDVTDRYVMLSNPHDGLGSLLLMMIPLRVVCWNTHSMAVRGASNVFKIRHRKNYKDKIEEAQKTLKLVNGYYDDLQGVMNELAKQKINEKAAAKFTVQLLPQQKIGDIVVNHERARNRIVELFKTGDGNRGETRWDLLNGVTQFVDHDRRTRVGKDQNEGEKRFNSSLFGTGAALKQRAFNMLVGKQD